MKTPVLKYPGAKWSLAAWIIQHMPAHNHYIEPYFGSGAVFFTKEPSRHEVVNDVDGDIINLFQVVREHGAALAAAIEMTAYSRQEYYLSYEETNDPLERARRYLVRCWQAHGTRAGSRTGWRHCGSKSVQPVSMQWQRLPPVIRSTMARLRDAEIESLSALAIIERYNVADAVLYVDPPYLLATGTTQLYRHGMSVEDHATLLDVLDEHVGSVLLSGYDDPLYTRRLDHWQRMEMRNQVQGGKCRTEVLWLNPAAASRQQSQMVLS